VTLLVHGALNGCTGSVQAREPLGVGTAHSAWAAAFDDPRLPPLQRRDYDHLVIEISVLSPLSRINVGSHEELVAALRPGVDGLHLTGAGRAGVFLPSVWQQLPDAAEFVRRLQAKAGLPPMLWPADMRASRFTATKFGGRAGHAT
jgi:AmmeMemoRadiSam system protein A